MLILSIETSCDETAIAIVDADTESRTFRILANQTISQIALHREYGGVFPMLAKREHARALVPLLVNVLREAALYQETSRHVLEHPLRSDLQEIFVREPELFASFITEIPSVRPPEIDIIAVTAGPGLEPALWTGINFAKALSLIWKVPVIPVDHMEGHIYASFLDHNEKVLSLPNITFPALALLVSGGHTELISISAWGEYRILGATRDDAVGEAFDKVARILGLPYPGGPEIGRLALSGRPGIYPLPRPMHTSDNYDFSFAGLKTAVLYLVKKLGTLSDQQKADIAREFEDAAVEVLVSKTLRAMMNEGMETVLVGGGVSANRRLRDLLSSTLKSEIPSAQLFIPSPQHATDNALMIAVAGAFRAGGNIPPLNDIKAEGHKKLG